MRRILSLWSIAGLFLLASGSYALAAEGAAAAAGLADSVKPWVAVAAGFGLAIAAFGGALGQSKAISAAVEGIARNPAADKKIFTPMIIGLALIESLVLYVFVLALLMFFKI